MIQEPNKIQKVLVVYKKTKYEIDLEKHKDINHYKQICKIQNNCFERVYHSHLRQLESRKIIQEVFTSGTFIFREGLDLGNIQEYDLIVSLGGDNHFTYTAHFAAESLIMGCNSDPQTSAGALLSFSMENLQETLKNNWSDTQIEKWSLISGEIEYPDGQKINTISAVSEISIRNNIPDLTSRYIISYNGISEEQKSSGILLSTGAGSTGWYDSCQIGEPEDVTFPKDSTYFKVYTRELNTKTRKNFLLTDFSVKGELKIISEMNGGIAIDSLSERIYNFPPGAIAHFRLSPKKLHVIIKTK
ncbi:MAG: NAD+ kinase [Leptospiraceae bacterium]|nr:NAD+ kinase [Leptospiraceae bacterium]MCP5494934.1 NAD+ kinase [Leptospiraceae bacterium]